MTFEPPVQQVESFPLTLTSWSSRVLLAAKDSDVLVLAAGLQLRVYSLKGALLASFEEHTMPISSMCVVGGALVWNPRTVNHTTRVKRAKSPSVFPSTGQLPRGDGFSGPLLTSADLEERPGPRVDPGEPVPPAGRLSHRVQVPHAVSTNSHVKATQYGRPVSRLSYALF